MSVLEVLWRRMFVFFGENQFLMDVIGSNVLSLAVFWSASGLLAFVDATGRPRWMSRYKSQPGKNEPVDRERLRKAIKVALVNQLFINLPGSILAMRLKHRLGISCRPEDLPRVLTVLRDLAVFVVIEEIGFYYTHRLVHWGPLYRTVHKLHHEWTAPIGVVAIYAHPVEFILSNLLPVALGPMLMRSHLFTVWVWYTLALVTTVIHHGGYHLPFLPSNEFHDFHHLKFTCNYGLTGWLDYLHGTDKQYRNTVQQRKDHMLLSLRPAQERKSYDRAPAD